MALYLVHYHLPGLTLQEVVAMQRAAMEMSARLTAEGKPVRYIRSTFVPSESHVMSLFEADQAMLVRDVSELAHIPFTRIVEAVDLTASP